MNKLLSITQSIGYACLALHVKNAALHSCTLRNATEENLRSITASNLSALENMIDYNLLNGVGFFRISSDLIPFGSHEVNHLNWKEEFRVTLERISDKIHSRNLRISMHPGQYSVLNSPDEKVVKRTVKDLEYHAAILDALQLDPSNKIILHVGGVYGDKEIALERFEKNWRSLPSHIKKRLVIENDEKCYSIHDIFHLGTQLGIPVVFDNLHHAIHQGEAPLNALEWIHRCRTTWNGEDGKQEIHYSQQNPAGKSGAHSKTIRLEPFLEFYSSIQEMNLNIMLEVKDKNISALKCIYATTPHLPAKYLEMEWTRYKYLVLSHSQQAYSHIQKLLKDKSNVSARNFYRIIEEALEHSPALGGEENAVLHVWSYFKETADEAEKRKFEKRLQDYMKGKECILSVKKYLYTLAEKYEEDDLLESYYFEF